MSIFGGKTASARDIHSAEANGLRSAREARTSKPCAEVSRRACTSGIISSYVNRVRQHGVNEHRMTEDTLSVVSQYRPDLARAPKSVFKDTIQSRRPP